MYHSNIQKKPLFFVEELHTIKVPPDKLLLPAELEAVSKLTRTQAILSEDAKRIFISGDPDNVDHADTVIHRKFESRVVLPLEDQQSRIIQNSKSHIRLIEEEFDVEIYEPENQLPFQNKLVVFGEQKSIKKSIKRLKKLLDNVTIIPLGKASRFSRGLDFKSIREKSQSSLTIDGADIILLGKTAERRLAKDLVLEFQQSVEVVESGIMTVALLGPDGSLRKQLIDETQCWLYYDIPGGEILVHGTLEQREQAKAFFQERLEKYDCFEISPHEIQSTVGLNKGLLKSLEAEFDVSLSIIRDKGVQISGSPEVRSEIKKRLEEYNSKISRIFVGNRLSFVMGANFENLKHMQEEYSCSLQVDFGSNEILIGADANPFVIDKIESQINRIMQNIDEIDLGPDLPLIIGRGAENIKRIKKEAGINVHHMRKDILFLEGSKQGRAKAKRMVEDLKRQISIVPMPGIELSPEQCGYVSRLSKCLVAGHSEAVHLSGTPDAVRKAESLLRDLQKKDDSSLPVLEEPPKEGQWLIIPDGESFQIFQFSHVDGKSGRWAGHLADQVKRLRSRSGKIRMTAPVHINYEIQSGMPVPIVSTIEPNPRIFMEPFEMDQLESTLNQPFRFYTKTETFLSLRRNQTFQKYHL